MVNTIENPTENKRLFEVMKTISKMEEPYSTKVANELEVQRSNIQSYIETMNDIGWINKERNGRRSIIKLNWEKIAADYYLDVKPEKIQDIENSPFQTLAEHMAYSANGVYTS